MATFSKTRALTSRKYVVTQGIELKIIGKTQVTLVALLRFCFRIITLEMFIGELHSPLVATFSEKPAVIWPKDMVKQGMNISEA